MKLVNQVCPVEFAWVAGVPEHDGAVVERRPERDGGRDRRCSTACCCRAR